MSEELLCELLVVLRDELLLVFLVRNEHRYNSNIPTLLSYGNERSITQNNHNLRIKNEILGFG